MEIEAFVMAVIHRAFQPRESPRNSVGDLSPIDEATAARLASRCCRFLIAALTALLHRKESDHFFGLTLEAVGHLDADLLRRGDEGVHGSANRSLGVPNDRDEANGAIFAQAV